MRRLLILLAVFVVLGMAQPRQIGWQKPPRGATIDFAHPLARGLAGVWLFNEGGGNMLAGDDGVALSWTPNGVAFNPGGTGFRKLIPLRSRDKASCFIRFRPDNITTFQRVCGYGLTAAAGNKLSLQIMDDGIGIRGIGGGNFKITSVYTLTIGKWHTAALTLSGGVLSLYIDGIFRHSVSGATDMPVGADYWSIGSRPSFDEDFRGEISYVALNDRVWSSSDIQALHRAPYQFIRSPLTRRLPSIAVAAPTAARRVLLSWWVLPFPDDVIR
jgi:hypothetical protein